jgi:glutamate/tyrosine decarboxylase-like PLP-dependent enzyme
MAAPALRQPGLALSLIKGPNIMQTEPRKLMETALEHAVAYRENVDARNPYPTASAGQLRNLFDTGLPDKGRPGEEVISHLVRAASPGLVGTSSKSFHGWVMGSSHPVGVAADWLTSAWGQNPAVYQTAPAAAIAEEVAGQWLIDLLDLPRQSSIAFSTGATMSSFICLAAARSEVMLRHGWDLEDDGIFGAPEISVFLSEEAHSTIFAVLRYLGFGNHRLIKISADKNGAMNSADLAEKLETCSGPKIIIAQAGHINSGAFDDFEEIARLTANHGAWMHVDGAFGLWARTSPNLKHLCDGIDLADSWSVDGHKWLQVPYDSGYAIVKHPQAHRRAMTNSADYLNVSKTDGRNPTHYGPELSRRARGFTVWAMLQAMGREGIARLVEDSCRNTQHLANKLRQIPGISILHKVSLNQLAISFKASGNHRDNDEITRETIACLQANQRWFVKDARWKDQAILRISLTSMPNSDGEINEFGEAVIDAYAAARAKIRAREMC